MRKQLLQRAIYLYPVLIFLWSCDDPFFWDSVQLASKQAHFFFENHLRWAPLPAQIDSGHPPALGLYLATCWTLFGKSLWISHAAMAPFLAGIIWALAQIGKSITPSWGGLLLLPLVLFDPVTAGQSIMVTPDILLLCGFLCAIAGIRTNRPGITAAAIALLCLTSMRGMACAAALGVWWLARVYLRKKDFRRIALQQAWVFLPGALLGLGFLLWHHKAAGWTGHHPESPWAPAFAPATARDMLRNVLILGWRWLDLNRFLEFALLGVLIRRFGWRIIDKDFLLLLAITAFSLALPAILHQNLSAHRYFMPGFAVLHLVCFSAIFHSGTALARPVRFGLPASLSAALLCGNLWVYPFGISMDWDATLAHKPYHRLHEKMGDFMRENRIPINRTGSAFPNLNSGEHLLLNGDTLQPLPFHTFAFDYAWISNVYNDLEPSDREKLQHNNWRLMKRLSSGLVWMEIYEKNIDKQ